MIVTVTHHAFSSYQHTVTLSGETKLKPRTARLAVQVAGLNQGFVENETARYRVYKLSVKKLKGI